MEEYRKNVQQNQVIQSIFNFKVFQENSECKRPIKNNCRGNCDTKIYCQMNNECKPEQGQGPSS